MMGHSGRSHGTAKRPRGAIQPLTPLGPDAVAVSTASHGGIRISLTALARLPEPLQATVYSGAGWFEEDCDWAIPYLALGLDAFEPDRDRGPRLPGAWRPKRDAEIDLAGIQIGNH